MLEASPEKELYIWVLGLSLLYRMLALPLLPLCAQIFSSAAGTGHGDAYERKGWVLSCQLKLQETEIE